MGLPSQNFHSVIRPRAKLPESSSRKESDFAPLDPQRAQEIEFIIDKAAANREAVVMDPDQGVTGSIPASLISPAANTNALVRYGQHYW